MTTSAPRVPRVCLLVCDSWGVGDAPDAAAYGDVGSDTLGNTARQVGGLDLPNLESLGLGHLTITPYVAWYSPESLDPTKPGVPNQRNIYLTHDGGIDLIATLDPGTTIDRLQISPDGAHVAFLTRASLTGYDNVSCEYEVPTESRGFEKSHVCKAMEEMYEYDANRHSLTCASCMRDGFADDFRWIAPFAYRLEKT